MPGSSSSSARWPIRPRRELLLGLAALAAFGACRQIEDLRETLEGVTPHERYADQLRRTGLDATALGRDWLTAAMGSLAAPHPVSLPFQESGYLPAEEATAVAYRFAARRGEQLDIEVRSDVADTALVFLDLYSASDTGTVEDRIASADSGTRALRHEIRRDGSYILRVQPELLRGGRYTVVVRTGPSLTFPVAGRDSRAVRSYWGAARDGGRRQHEGVDIFAPRGTAVIAAANGYVRRANTTPIGGKVVWLRDADRGQSLYYAHLDSQVVTAGMQVRVGDTLGFVGNTGNARTTPPHLHFGIYQRGSGAVDPFPFVREVRERPPRIAADTTSLGRYARVTRAPAPLRVSPEDRAPQLARLERFTAVRLLGASGSWYRVRLPDGRHGWVSARAMEPALEPVRRERVAAAAAVLDEPAPVASVMDSVAAGASLSVLGSFDDWLLVEAPSGRLGWVPMD